MSVTATIPGQPLNTGLRRASRAMLFVRFFMLLACLAPLKTVLAQADLEQVTLQLKSRPYFQAAGFYTAQALGFYRSEGLLVQILPGQPGTSSLESVLDKTADYGIGDISVLAAYLDNKPVTALASLFQHDSFKLVSLKNAAIQDPQDLRGKRITVARDNGLLHLQMLLHREGIPESAVTIVPGRIRAEELISGNTDVIGIMSDWELSVLDSQHIGYNVINGMDHGIDVYGHILFTRQDEARDHPERLEAFLRATKKGWMYAMDHPDTASQYILQSGQAGGITRSQLMRQADGLKKLIMSDILEVGHMSDKRWQQISSQLAGMGLVRGGKPIEPFLYDSGSQQRQRLTRQILLGVAVIAILLALVLVWNLLMHRSVKRRTRELRDEIGRRVQAEQQLYDSLRADQLTGLPNKRALHEHICKLLDRCAADDQHAALLFIDLNRFQRVTITFGRDVSDRIIQEVTRILSERLSPGDFLARVGRDQFILIPAFCHRDRQRVADFAADYARQLQLPFQSMLRVGTHEQLISMNIGIALSEESCQQTDLWIKRAELAMHDSKNAENQSISFFDPESEKHIVSRSALEADIRRALEQSEFRVYYQLQVDETGQAIGAEALIRWQLAGGEMVNPGEFILVTEESGQIIAIGAWMIEAVCRQLAAWALHPERQDLRISVNVSARQLHHPDFAGMVRDILARTHAEPGKLQFEVTESIFLDRSRETIDKLRQLNAMGIHFSVDDFGTGYSSLSYLLQQQLFSEIKIPRPFVAAALTNPNAGYIMDAMIRLAQRLNMSIVAEGVETEAQRNYLYEHGCRIFQGYLISPPVPLDELETLLDQQQTQP